MENFAFKNWNLKNLMKYILPSILSMMFLGLYTTVDGLFVSRYVGAEGVAAINIAFPSFALIYGVAIMLTIGGNTLIGIKLGEKNNLEASRMYSQTVIFLTIFSLLAGVVGFIYSKQIATSLGATDVLLADASIYIKVLLSMGFFTCIKIGYEFFLRTENQAQLSLYCTVLGGIINIVLDYLFIVKFSWGVAGAAYATGLGWIGSLIIPLYFYLKKENILHFTLNKPDLKFLKDITINGSSELVTELATGFTTFLFNITILKLAGEIGVAAVAIITYMNFLFSSFFIGTSLGIQPIISWYFGAKDFVRLHKVLKLTFIVIAISAVFFVSIAYIFGNGIVQIFANDNLELTNIATKALYLFTPAFLLIGLNILGSSFFTSINDGKRSAILSFLRTLIFVVFGILILPIFFGLNGIWITIPVAESLTIFVTYIFLKNYRKRHKAQMKDLK